MYHGVNLTGWPLAVDLRSGPRPDGWQESAPFAGDLASAGMAAATTATDALRHELEHPAAAMHALGVLQDAKTEQLAARLEAWAMSLPPRPSEDPTTRRRAKWERNNRDSYALARVMATMPTCEHRSCRPGRCAYSR
jgi:hypothetical protein